MKNLSYWLDIPYVPHPPLEENVEVDIVVVGAGITGVSAAYHSAVAGYKTVLIDKDYVASGSAGKNGGMVVEGLALDFAEAVEEFGEKMAQEAWQRTIESREYVASLIEKHGIECDFSRPGSLYLTATEPGKETLEKELRARKADGFFDGKICSQSNPAGTALFVSKDCLLHPVKFVRGLAKIAEERGLIIHEQTKALSFDAHSVSTSKGRIAAKKVIVAVESEKKDLSPEEVAVHREFALVTEPLSEKDFAALEWNMGGMFWTTGHDYIAARRIGTRFFLNGTISMDPSEIELDQAEEKVITSLLKLFPRLSREKLITSHRWTGLLLYPERSRPFIVNRGYYELYANGGNGLTNGVMLGKLVVESFAGNKIPEIYREDEPENKL